MCGRQRVLDETNLLRQESSRTGEASGPGPVWFRATPLFRKLIRGGYQLHQAISENWGVKRVRAQSGGAHRGGGRGCRGDCLKEAESLRGGFWSCP